MREVVKSISSIINVKVDRCVISRIPRHGSVISYLRLWAPHVCTTFELTRLPPLHVCKRRIARLLAHACLQTQDCVFALLVCLKPPVNVQRFKHVKRMCTHVCKRTSSDTHVCKHPKSLNLHVFKRAFTVLARLQTRKQSHARFQTCVHKLESLFSMLSHVHVPLITCQFHPPVTAIVAHPAHMHRHTQHTPLIAPSPQSA